MHTSYVSWFGSVQTGPVLTSSVRSNSVRPVRSGPVRLGPNPFRPVRFGPVRFEPNPFGPVRSDRFGLNQILSDRFARTGSVRTDSLFICVIIGKSPYPGNIPSIPDCTKYRIIIACTVTVQLPMRVLHGRCYSCTSGGDDQSPNVVHYCWTMV